MKKISLFLLICILGSAVATSATILRDTTTGIENLEWLEFEYTQNMSRNEVEANILNTTLYEGYRYATREETSLLLNSYYKYDITDIDDGWSKATRWVARDFLSDFGLTYSHSYDNIMNLTTSEGTEFKTNLYEQATFMYGSEVYMSGEIKNTLLGHVAMHSFYGGTKAGWFHQSQGTDKQYETPMLYDISSTNPIIASLLVRDVQPVPEPTTILLFGTGLIGLVGSKIRKKKK